MDTIRTMITTVTQKNMVSVPAEVARAFGIRPGYRLDWSPIPGREEILVKVLPDRAELARRLFGAGRGLAPDRDAIEELVREREEEDRLGRDGHEPERP